MATTTIKIISNPYSRNLSFFCYQEQTNTWTSITQESINSRLREHDEEKIFFQFKVKEIIDIIISEYYVGTDPIDIIFEGPSDEYGELLNVSCEDDVKDKIHLIRSPRVLESARDIKEHTKKVFATVQPVIQEIIQDDPEVLKGLNKVADALSDIIPICIFGNYSAGKSTFINALIGHEILPSGGDPVTAKIFEIKRSRQDDRASVTFSYLDKEYVLKFSPDDCRVMVGDKSVDLIREIFERIHKLDDSDMFWKVYETVELINSYEKRDKTVTVIGNVIKIEVPFSKYGVIGQSQNNFVIFDTPGSNSNSNIDHEKVLSKALEGFSNGIPVWVSVYDSVDSVDNANLCEKLYKIDALDKRFTMIVINKADSVELRKNVPGKRDIMMEYESVEKMYSSGIFFVSSVMGLGAKNLDGIISEYLLEVYDEKTRKFSDPEARSYLKLYEYNIMPEQMKERAVEYSQMCDNLIYANSGLYCIEMEMEQFGSKHSEYNKCQMVYMFLKNVIAETDRRINAKAASLEQSKKRREQELDARRIALVDKIKTETTNELREFERDSKLYVKKYVKETLVYERTSDELERADESIAEQNEQDVNFASYERDYERAKNNRWRNLQENGKNMLTGDFVQAVRALATEWASDSKSVQRKKDSMDTTRQNVDKTTSDSMLKIVIDEFKKNMNEAQEKLWKICLTYWQNNAQQYREQVSRTIMGTDALSEKQRTELNAIILQYPPIRFDDEADKVFIKAKFLRGNVLGIKIGGGERLNISRLTYSYNSKIRSNISEMAELINSSCFTGFKDWQNKLLALIEENITIYNPELRVMSELIRDEEKRITRLQTNQELISKSLKTIEAMMSWNELN